MAGFAVKRIDDMEGIYGGAFKRVRAELGIESFGIQVIEMPPNADQYPEHDHSEDGQEEVYVALSGRGEIEIDGERFEFEPETMIRVSSGTKRKVWPGDEGLRVLIVGATPGQLYEPPQVTKLGEPDPLAQAQQS
jgi:mannose-6-phosphate isomerase-like protein (cupin superfamily)